MKNLIYKELKLVIHPAVYLFALLSLMLLIPHYPYAVGIAYFFMGVQVTFSLAKGNKDTEFTAMLPVPRRAIVLSRHITVMILQLAQILVAVPCALISSLVLNPAGNPVGMDANFAFFGLTFIQLAVFNLIFLPAFYKTGYKMAWPLFFGALGYILTTVFFEALIQLVPALKYALDSLNPASFVYQIPVLIAGAAIYIGTFFASYKLSEKNFERVSL